MATLEEKIARINELYRKSKNEGLTESELEEQAALRKDYIANVRANLRGTLNNVSLVNEDGSVENLGEKYGNENTH